MLTPDERGQAMNILRKTFTATTITIPQERMLGAELERARDYDVAIRAIERMYADGVTYPHSGHVRQAIGAEHRAMALKEWNVHRDEGPFVTFVDWYAAQDADMQARVRRVFPSLDVEAWA